MSLIDNLSTLPGKLFPAFGAPTISISRPGARTEADRVAGRRGTSTTTTFTATGIIAPRTVRAPDGTYERKLIARLDAEVRIGDRLTVASSTYTVTAVEEIAPAGTTFLWIATLS